MNKLLILLLLIPSISALSFGGSFTGTFGQSSKIDSFCSDGSPGQIGCAEIREQGSFVKKFDTSVPTIRRIQTKIFEPKKRNVTYSPSGQSAVKVIRKISGKPGGFGTNEKYAKNCVQEEGNIVCPGIKVIGTFNADDRRQTLGGGFSIGTGLTKPTRDVRNSRIYSREDYMRESLYY